MCSLVNARRANTVGGWLRKTSTKRFQGKERPVPALVLAFPKMERNPLDIRVRFGRAIRRIREEQEIIQEEAAERCGLHRAYYCGIERGVKNVSLRNIEKIAKGLKTSL